MRARNERLQPAAPNHFGAGPGVHWDGRGALFAVQAPDAERVELCLFDAGGRHEIARYALPDCTDGLWRGYLPECKPGQLYGYRVGGPYEPTRGLRFNPNKLLIDPYARALRGPLTWHDSLYGYRIGGKRGDLSFDRRDSAPYLPKAVVVAETFDWGDDRAPRTPWSDTVVYEVHVKGFTQRHPGIPERDRGTFGGLGHPATVDYLRRLGVTAVELLPIHAFARDRMLLERGLTNYWGYNTLAFFAPEPAYLSDGSLGQVKWAVQQLHRAGIEVILDVVYNHTCEGSELGATLSWRGFGDATFYRLLPDNPRHHINDTGCGNTVNTASQPALRMVLDSLRHWVTEYRIDGFRFDLGLTLGREPHGFDPGAGFFDALLQDPVLSKVKLISEPWDIGPGGYQLGNHPPGMSEWNDKYRDEVRRFWRGDAGMRGALSARLQGSADLFDRQWRKPTATVNFVTAHDGFTLADWASYAGKHNEANGEDNRDGTDNNCSANWGVEGPTDDAAIRDTRGRLHRAMLATLLTSLGTPMLLGGDEFGRSQSGNNNAYCQDNELSWLDWALADSADGRALRDFTERLLRLRREHPALRAGYFQHGRDEPAAGVRDIGWFDESGGEMTSADWEFAGGQLLTVRRAVRRPDGGTDIVAILFNASGEDREFTLPAPTLEWSLQLDSAQPDRAQGAIGTAALDVVAHSLVVLTARADALAPPPGPKRLPPAAAQPRDNAPIEGA
ncbi:MAG TPA: glycogen debranching protein GlgX [Verrucomicrobiae bacterium]|nr:glycogen debranching protein GlgX [Verrucomicrobiae bacterium]